MGWFSSKPLTPAASREIPTFVPISAPLPPPDEATGPSPDRHNSPNLAAQLEQAGRRTVEAVICSALDGEKRLPLNAAVAARRAGEVLAGVRRVVEKTGASRACVVIDAASPAAWKEPILAAAERFRTTVVELPHHYPQADPTMLLYALTGRRLKPAALPTEQGIVLLDPPAALTLDGEKTVPIGVLDHRNQKATFLDVPLGMALGAALAAAGVATDGTILLGGDFLRDTRISPAQSLGNGELAIHILPAPSPRPAQACIRCGWCAQICPTGVSPAWILEAAQRHEPRLARQGGLGACIECGLCNQVCPAHLPLLEAIRQMKQT
jgi:electron transport complex protein RnfC